MSGKTGPSRPSTGEAPDIRTRVACTGTAGAARRATPTRAPTGTALQRKRHSNRDACREKEQMSGETGPSCPSTGATPDSCSGAACTGAAGAGRRVNGRRGNGGRDTHRRARRSGGDACRANDRMSGEITPSRPSAGKTPDNRTRHRTPDARHRRPGYFIVSRMPTRSSNVVRGLRIAKRVFGRPACELGTTNARCESSSAADHRS